MTTSEWCRCFYYFDQERQGWFLHGSRCCHHYCTVSKPCWDNLHKIYFTDDRGTLLTWPTAHISSLCTGLSCERMEQITECCYDSCATLNMPHILHGMSKLESYKIFALVGLQYDAEFLLFWRNILPSSSAVQKSYNSRWIHYIIGYPTHPTHFHFNGTNEELNVKSIKITPNTENT